MRGIAAQSLFPHIERTVRSRSAWRTRARECWEDSLDKIFTAFYRLDDARDRWTGGTGLGLAIVRTCIEACGGTVQRRNRRPSGLEVIVELPEA